MIQELGKVRPAEALYPARRVVFRRRLFMVYEQLQHETWSEIQSWKLQSLKYYVNAGTKFE